MQSFILTLNNKYPAILGFPLICKACENKLKTQGTIIGALSRSTLLLIIYLIGFGCIVPGLYVGSNCRLEVALIYVKMLSLPIPTHN